VLFGGGAENFLPTGSYKNQDYYSLFSKAGYNVVHNKTDLLKIDNKKRAVGLFSVSNMAKWLDRNVYTKNLLGQKNSPTGDKTDAVDQPGLKEMTIKVRPYLDNRARQLILLSRLSTFSALVRRPTRTRAGIS
jgi:alkaline phosphatase